MANSIPVTDRLPLCVGRDQEIAGLHAQLERTQAAQGVFCHVTGEAGAGKSTLLRAFTASLQDADDPAVIAWGHCDQQSGSLRPLAPWTDILQSFSGTAVSAIPGEGLRDRNRVVQSIRSTLAEFAPDIIELLIPGVGLMVKSAKLLKRTSLGERLSTRYSRPLELEVDADRTRLQDQYVAIIERVLAQTPLIIVMDDLDCGDEASLQLLQRIVERTRERRILFVVASRPSRGHGALASALSQISATVETMTLDLDGIQESRGVEFVTRFLGAQVPGIGQAFAQEVLRRTGGNPLFVSELIEHMLAHGQITQDNGNWKLVSDSAWTGVPARIDGILASQLGRLDSELRDILQAASVEGSQFSIEVLAAVTDRSPLAISRALARRAPRNLVVAVGSRPLGAGQVSMYRFTHSLAHQHIYAGIDPIERTYMHLAVAEQLEHLAGQATQAIATQLAIQFERAQRAERAVHYFEQAARQAIATCSLTEAMGHLERALQLCAAGLPRMHVLHSLAKLKLMVGEGEASVGLAEEAAGIALEQAAPQLCLILADQALALMRTNELGSARSVAEQAKQQARTQADQFGLLSALETLGQISSKQGQQQAALAQQAEALELARELGDPDLLASSLSKWGWYLKEVGRYEEARAALDQSLALQTAGQPNYSHLARTYNALADLDISTENYHEARHFMLQAIDCWRQFDRNSDVAVGLSNLANLANREGLFAEALQYGREAYRMDLKALGENHPELAFSLSCIGESLAGLGHYPEAIESLEQAYALRRTHGAPASNLAWTGWLLGKALVGRNPASDEGLRLVDEARTELAELGAAAASEVKEIDEWLAAQGQTK